MTTRVTSKTKAKPEPVPLRDWERELVEEFKAYVLLKNMIAKNLHGAVAQNIGCDPGEFRAFETILQLRLKELRDKLKSDLRISANERLSRRHNDTERMHRRGR